MSTAALARHALLVLFDRIDYFLLRQKLLKNVNLITSWIFPSASFAAINVKNVRLGLIILGDNFVITRFIGLAAVILSKVRRFLHFFHNSIFHCRAINWIEENKDCSLLGVDRHVLAGTTAFSPVEGSDYLERNCVVGEPRRLCIYDRVKGKILKTVDSVYQAIDSREDCEDLCNTAPFRCHSYDYNDTGDFVCRLSHHSAHTLTQIGE